MSNPLLRVWFSLARFWFPFQDAFGLLNRIQIEIGFIDGPLIFKVWHAPQALASVLNFRDGLDRKMPERKAVASFAARWWIHPPCCCGCYRYRHPPLGLNHLPWLFASNWRPGVPGILQTSSLRLRLVRQPFSLTNEMVATDRPTISAKPSFSSDYMLSLLVLFPYSPRPIHMSLCSVRGWITSLLYQTCWASPDTFHLHLNSGGEQSSVSWWF